MYASGASIREIGRVKNRSHTNIRRHLLKRGVKLRNHSEAAERQRKYVPCVICGCLFNPAKNHGRKTCSDGCFTQLMHRIQLDDQNSNWCHGGSQSRYQRVARESKHYVCEECGASNVRLDVHHKNKDKSDNSPNNLKILCVSCHAKEHYENGDCSIRGAPKPPEVVSR